MSSVRVCFQTIRSTAHLCQKLKGRMWIMGENEYENSIKGTKIRFFEKMGKCIHTLEMPFNCFYICLCLFLSLELGNRSKR